MHPFGGVTGPGLVLYHEEKICIWTLTNLRINPPGPAKKLIKKWSRKSIPI